jgi:hypothetical protein
MADITLDIFQAAPLLRAVVMKVARIEWAL